VDAPLIRRRLVVRGLVQGVGFRYSLQRLARTRGVAGWVGNRADGAVEIVLEGPADAVGALLEWCRHGPRGAVVREVSVDDEEPEGLEGFSVAR
jgi:acylphosphatase